jgi:hypothetical protein
MMCNGRLVLIHVKNALHQGPPLARSGVRIRLLESPHQTFPFGDAIAGRTVRLEGNAIVEPVAHLNDHHEAASEQMDVHLPDPNAAKTAHDLRPDLSVITAIGVNRHGIVFKVESKN